MRAPFRLSQVPRTHPANWRSRLQTYNFHSPKGGFNPRRISSNPSVIRLAYVSTSSLQIDNSWPALRLESASILSHLSRPSRNEGRTNDLVSTTQDRPRSKHVARLAAASTPPSPRDEKAASTPPLHASGPCFAPTIRLSKSTSPARKTDPRRGSDPSKRIPNNVPPVRPISRQIGDDFLPPRRCLTGLFSGRIFRKNPLHSRRCSA